MRDLLFVLLLLAFGYFGTAAWSRLRRRETIEGYVIINRENFPVPDSPRSILLVKLDDANIPATLGFASATMANRYLETLALRPRSFELITLAEACASNELRKPTELVYIPDEITLGQLLQNRKEFRYDAYRIPFPKP